MRAVFADTGYWIAISNPRDALHLHAKNVSRALSPVRIVTSEMVLAWSHTDCASFRIMDRYRLTEALTYDGHFEQAGFTALLREP